LFGCFWGCGVVQLGECFGYFYFCGVFVDDDDVWFECIFVVLCGVFDCGEYVVVGVDCVIVCVDGECVFLCVGDVEVVCGDVVGDDQVVEWYWV